ncbi:MAG TPA: hypothetical protein VF773_00860 [Verrucomicrobiae bacterium]
MALLAITALVAAACSHGYWMRLGTNEPDWRKRYWAWLIQGFVFPWLIFCFFNIGWGGQLPPLVPEILEAQRAKAPWFRLWLTWCAIGAMLVAFHWAAITYLWLLNRIVQQAEDRREIALNIAFFGFFTFSIASILTYATGWIYIGPAVCFALLPIVHFTVDLVEKPPAHASYDKAIAQLKRGNIQDAEWEVITQLEKSENDFGGWMLLAEMYAKEYRNIEDAARVILDVCKQPGTQAVEISIACHKLADWQLEIAQNPIGARAALELLCRKIPGTHFAFMAQQRIRQIPSSIEEFDEAKKGRKIRLQPLAEDRSTSEQPDRTSRPDAIAEANRLSEKLTADPNDIPAREKLAYVLGEKLSKINLAVEQLNLLLDLPDATDEQKSKWLAQIASWEFNRDKDSEKFQSALRALLRRYPQTSHAFAAQRRLFLMEMDFAEQQQQARPAPIPTLKVT